jgi:membrane protease YdiL (CAAX protease family)/tetratricopeptide (TPR) repeat protein
MNEPTPRDGLEPSRRRTNPELEKLLQEGIDAARSGYDQRARDLLLQVLEQDPGSVRAWLWLSGVVDTPGEKELCLEQVINIEPDHVAARRGLLFLREQRQAEKRQASAAEPGMQYKEPKEEVPLAAQPSTLPDPDPAPDVVYEPSIAEAAPEGPLAAGVYEGGRNAEAVALTQAEAPVEGTLEADTFPVADMDDLMRPAIAAARAGHLQRARELLSRVITIDEKYVSAWMWLSYVASDEKERDRCLRKVLALAVPGTAPALAPAGAMAGGGVETWSPPGPLPRSGSRLSASALSASAVAGASSAAPLQTASVARPALPRPQLPDVALFDGAGITQRLRTLYLDWATTWTFIALAYLAAIAVAEILTAFAPARTGLVAHAAVLLVVMIHAARVEGKKEQAFLVSLAFAPLIRVVSLSLPLADLPLLYWYLITSIPLFAAALIAAPTLGFSWPDLGLNLRRWGLQLVIGLSGIAFGVLEYWILRPDPLVDTFEWTALLWPALILLISTGLLEEMIFRGLLQRASLDVLGVWGIGYIAILFAVLHTGYKSLLDVLFVAAVGLFFGWVVHRTRSLLGVTLAHGLTNIVLLLVLPFVLG